MKKTAVILTLVLLLGVALAATPRMAWAQEGGEPGGGGLPEGGEPLPGDGNSSSTGGGGGGGIVINLPNPLKCGDAVCVRDSLIKAAQLIGWYLVTIMVLWGGFQILTAAGNPEKLATGRRTIFYAVIGFMVLLLAASFVYVIQSLLNTAAN